MALFKRKLFYLGGFDPRGARFYHQMLADEIDRANAAATPPGTARIGPPRRRDGDVEWTVTDEATGLASTHRFLVWDDLVRRHWVKGPVQMLLPTLRAYRGFLGRFDWGLVARVPRGSVFTLFYPGLSLFLLPAIMALLLWLPLRLLMPEWVALTLALAGGISLGLYAVQRIYGLWLLRFVIFNDLFARRRTDPALDDRIATFARKIGDALADADDTDEILLVTHSNGSILAVPLMAQLLDRFDGTLPARFTLVTLGGCMQLMACRRDAGWFHAHLDRLAEGHFRWLDIGSLTDGACVPLMDPALGRPRPRPEGLVQFSPRWFRYCDPATYRARRRNKYETHFDYLRRLDLPSPLDYVALTTAARPLAASIAAFEADNAGPRHG